MVAGLAFCLILHEIGDLAAKPNLLGVLVVGALQVSMADFMTDEDLEALKTDAHPHRTDAGHSTGVQASAEEHQQRLHG